MLQLLAKHALAGAFEDNEVRILVDAFDQAWKAVQDSGAPFASEGQATRERLALRIIEIAQLGERDRNQLRDDSVVSGANKSEKHGRVVPCSTVLYLIPAPQAIVPT